MPSFQVLLVVGFDTLYTGCERNIRCERFFFFFPVMTEIHSPLPDYNISSLYLQLRQANFARFSQEAAHKNRQSTWSSASKTIPDTKISRWHSRGYEQTLRISHLLTGRVVLVRESQPCPASATQAMAHSWLSLQNKQTSHAQNLLIALRKTSRSSIIPNSAKCFTHSLSPSRYSTICNYLSFTTSSPPQLSSCTRSMSAKKTLP